jgi:hypothetical protein
MDLGVALSFAIVDEEIKKNRKNKLYLYHFISISIITPKGKGAN